MRSNKKILLVTGKLAEALVRKYSSESKLDTEVRSIPVSVATFMTSDLLVNELKNLDLTNFSILLIPGLARCNPKEIEDRLGLPTFMGPKYAADIPFVLDNLERIELSKEMPACELLKAEIEASLRERLLEIEVEGMSRLSQPFNFLVGRGKSAIAAGKDFPTRIIAEIADAPLLSDEEIIGIAKRHLENGAEILDIGMVASKGMSGEVSRLVSILRDNFDVPISIDSLNEREIQAAIDNDIDLILSVDGGIINSFPNLDIPVVLVPINLKRGYYPREPSEKVKYLLDLAKKAKKLDYKRVIVDPILEPINRGFVQSLIGFYELRKLEPNIPVLMGVGNVIELCDADSVGMVALLAGAAGELEVSFLLTVEASNKTKGNVREVRKAREMMTLARVRESVPKDLGLDLLFLKDKRDFSDVYDEKIERKLMVIKARPVAEFKPDVRGAFKIFVDQSQIIAVLYTGRDPKIVIRGKTAEEVCNEIIGRGLISEMDHAAYLGRELQKAEIALKTGKGYLQDKELF
jgi:dihydropteroate synthase-like protein